LKIGSIVEVPRSHFISDEKDKENLVIRVTKIVDNEHMEGRVLKNSPQKWGNNSHVYFNRGEIVTSKNQIKEVVTFTCKSEV
jgi:hypothetical protein